MIVNTVVETKIGRFLGLTEQATEAPGELVANERLSFKEQGE